jgi:hypothetical protein
MALEMKDSEPIHGADLGLFDWSQFAMTVAQRAQIVGFSSEMNLDPLIPIRPIERSPVASFIACSWSAWMRLTALKTSFDCPRSMGILASRDHFYAARHSVGAAPPGREPQPAPDWAWSAAHGC